VQQATAWRDNLQKALAPLLLTVLGTVLYQSGITIYRISDQIATLPAEAERKVQRVDRMKEQNDAADKMMDGWREKQTQREKELTEIQKALILGTRKDSDIHGKAMDMLREINV